MKHSKQREGFSLILSLTVMVGIVLLLLTLSAFLTVESRAAMNQQLATRARLNAIASMRLALAHLQQEAGADRRSTARADITQPAATASNVRNPMWTGVWRTDFPDLPPAWLVSGRADQPAGTQTVSLFQSGSNHDYLSGYWFPWLSGYNPSDDKMVNLVGPATVAPAESGKLNGFVSLPKVALPDEDISGSYAYWIGDEGIKARVNLREVRSENPDDATQIHSVRGPVTQGLLKSLTNPSELDRFTQLNQAPLLSGIEAALGTAGSKDVRKSYHDITTVSAGVLADSRHGGLKRDLSTAFELADDQFAATEFGQGSVGAAATHVGRDHLMATDPEVTGYGEIQMPVLKKKDLGDVISAAPIFTRFAKDTSGLGTLSIRGPTWWALRDYHRLYKSLGWAEKAGTGRLTTTPTLLARALWPNLTDAHPDGKPANSGLANNSLRNRLYGYSDIYNADQSTASGPVDPNASDLLNGDTGRIVTRPLAVSANPYVQRVSLAFSVNKMQWFEWRQIKIGKNIIWYQVETVDLRVNITPIVVMHNPYNVRMTWQPNDATPSSANKRAFGVALSVADIAGWKFRFKQYGNGAPAVFETSLTDFFKRQSGEVDDDDTFRLYLANDSSEGDASSSARIKPITFEPGEFRVFSCEPKFGEWSKDIVLGNAYSTRGGFRDNVLDWNLGPAAEDAFDINSPIGMEIIPEGKVRVRHAVASRPKDQLILDSSTATSAAMKKESFFYDSSEASEVVVTDINASKYPSPGEKFFMSWRHVRNKTIDGLPGSTQPTLEPDLISVIDITAKPADAAGAPFPSVTHSNPLAAVQRASAGGRRNGVSGDAAGFLGVSPSYQLSVRNGAWENILEFPPNTNGKKAFGGYSMTSNGADTVILTEVPLVQPTSLAHFAHANFGIRDQQPLLGIGSSFASPYVRSDKAYQQNGQDWTEMDQTYLLNAALWDGFFLSSVAPWMKTGVNEAISPAPATPPDIVSKKNDKLLAADPSRELKSASKVIEDFVLNGVPLDNPRFSLDATDKEPEILKQALGDYRRAATVLLNKGAFNVNSTSVEAWTSFLGSAKAFAIAKTTKDLPKAAENARFPRFLSKTNSAPADKDVGDPSNWSGFANLSDMQLAALAKAIVDENKLRFGLSQRTERELVKPPGLRRFGNLPKPATPYLGLAEFINRFLGDDTWASRTGTLQSAILRADRDNALTPLYSPLSKKTGHYEVTSGKLETITAGTFPHPENIEIPRPASISNPLHTALAAPGNLLQSDLLQSLGSALTTRSDTFTIRCYGEAAQASGETGSAWMEVVVQRVPEFIDPTNAPETGNSAPRPLKIAPYLGEDASISTALTKVNNVLGRRFKITSMRWLKADEI
jgi:hypothetical protein